MLRDGAAQRRANICSPRRRPIGGEHHQDEIFEKSFAEGATPIAVVGAAELRRRRDRRSSKCCEPAIPPLSIAAKPWRRRRGRWISFVGGVGVFANHLEHRTVEAAFFGLSAGPGGGQISGPSSRSSAVKGAVGRLIEYRVAQISLSSARVIAT